MATLLPMTTTTTTTHTRGFVALLLLTAGTLVLAGKALPVVGDALPLVLGIELLAWAYVARDNGPLIAGGIVTGIGCGVLLAASPLLGAQPHTVGAAFLLSIAGGFALVAILTGLWLHRTATWAWITAIAVAVVGGGLLGGPDTLGVLLSWTLPAALLAGGAVAALRRSRT